MSPETLEQIEEIYHQALELPSNQRNSFLLEVCENDEVRSEVESLLSFDEKPNDFIDDPLGKFAGEIFPEAGEDRIIGGALAQYRIVSLLGSGGMGEVFLAEDAVLQRKVALKFLPDKFANDRERTRRFEIEAKSVSAINHPNIMTIYQIGAAGKRHFIVAEYIDGKTLREFLISNKPDFQKILDIAIQITSALEAAHRNGIVHRDLKPENIMIRPDGFVKVLDFGVAKLIEESNEETASSDFQTEPGRIIGTKNYMSPEQALGKTIDTRSDIFSFGVVLYELAAGILPFAGSSDAEFFDALLNREPEPLGTFDQNMPRELENIINRALEKDADLRYQTVSDLRAELMRLKRDTTTGSRFAAAAALQKRPENKNKSNILIKAAVLLAIILGVSAFALYALRDKMFESGNTASVKNAAFSQLTEQSGRELFAQISPDGKTVYFASRKAEKWDIYSQRTGGKTAVNLTADSGFDDTQPAVSPDGELIAFRSERNGGGIFVMGASGESVRRVTDSGFYPAWSPDQKEIVFCQDNFSMPDARSVIPSELQAVNPATGETRVLTKIDAVQPNWSPNGTRIAFWGTNSGGIREIFTVAADGRSEPVKVTNDAAFNWNPVWSPDGKYLYFASNRGGGMNFWRVAVDEQTGEVSGAAEAVATPSTYSQHLSFSADGNLLAYVNVNKNKNIYRIAFDEKRETLAGDSEQITSGSRSATIPSVSNRRKIARLFEFRRQTGRHFCHPRKRSAAINRRSLQRPRSGSVAGRAENHLFLGPHRKIRNMDDKRGRKQSAANIETQTRRTRSVFNLVAGRETNFDQSQQ